MQRRVLVVDDDADTRQAMHLRLSQAGFQTVTAGSGADAIASYEVVQPDIVLLDASMPDVSGFDVCRYIKEQSVGPTAHVIFVSGTNGASRHYLEQCARMSGADQFVSKPYDGANLVELVRSVKRPE